MAKNIQSTNKQQPSTARINMKIESQALNEVLQDWSLWPILNQCNQAACTFTPLEQGLTNENWLVTLSKVRLSLIHSSDTQVLTPQNSVLETPQQFVIRINASNAQSLNIDHKSEYEIVESISALDLCPIILYKEPSFKYWVRPYIDGHTLAELEAHDFNINNELASIARILRQAHKQPIKSHWPSVDIIERAEYFWQQILPKPSINTPEALRLKRILDDALQIDNPQTALCHMDTNIHNWIKDSDGKLHLIDWEYAGRGNPIWDLAVFSDSAKLNTQEEEQLLAFYGEYSLTQLHHAKLQMEYLSILWFAIQKNTDANTLLCELKNLASRTH